MYTDAVKDPVAEAQHEETGPGPDPEVAAAAADSSDVNNNENSDKLAASAEPAQQQEEPPSPDDSGVSIEVRTVPLSRIVESYYISTDRWLIDNCFTL